MEPDRYQLNQKYYVVGLVCLVISMLLFGIGAYILPYIAFGLSYNIPDFIYSWITIVQEAYGVSEKSAGWLIVLAFFGLGFVAAIVTYVTSKRIDNEIYATEEPEKEVEENKPAPKASETGPFVLKIALILGLVFIVAELFRWTISS